MIGRLSNEIGSVFHKSTEQLTAANANATMVRMGVSELAREVDPAERPSAAAIRASRFCISKLGHWSFSIAAALNIITWKRR